MSNIESWENVRWIIDIDIRKCFVNIKHEKLIEIIGRYYSDKEFLALIWKALKAGIIYSEDFLKAAMCEYPGENPLGTPQGYVLSPLLCNIYKNEFDQVVIDKVQMEINNSGYELYYCRYADYMILGLTYPDR